MADTPWRLADGRASLAWSGLQASLDLRRADLGLTIIQWRGIALSQVAPLGIVFPGVAAADPVCDAYQRGLDLIATYPESPERPFRVQAYWRCVPAPVDVTEAVAIELQLSVQTPLLDCFPSVHTRTSLGGVPSLDRTRCVAPPGEHSSSAGGEVFHAQVATSPRSVHFVEMIHCADLQSNRLDRDAETWRLEHDLFEPGLEKGVIRRVRVRVLFYEGATSGDFLECAYRAFHQAPLPLTT